MLVGGALITLRVDGTVLARLTKMAADDADLEWMKPRDEKFYVVKSRPNSTVSPGFNALSGCERRDSARLGSKSIINQNLLLRTQSESALIPFAYHGKRNSHTLGAYV